MPAIDHHDTPYDEGTIAKLELFEKYAEAWLPTFVMSGVREICIFDFFAGTGYDNNQVPGSAIRLLDRIKYYEKIIIERKTKIQVFLNEYKRDKFTVLQEAVNKYIEDNPQLKSFVEIDFYNEDFGILFEKLYTRIQKFPSLVYLDQNGIKYLADKYLLALEKTKKTDFLYFVSSSYFLRFGERPEFRVNLDLDIEYLKKNPYKAIHRSLIEQLKNKLPDDTKLRLYPFSIKKGSNIHGIIFGATHIRAVDKFLTISWARNSLNGEADYDIDDDGIKEQLDLFEGKRLTKIESFNENIRDKILKGIIKNNRQAYDFCLSQGHLGRHGAEVIREMKKEKLVDYDSRSPMVTYENVYDKRKIIMYKVLK